MEIVNDSNPLVPFTPDPSTHTQCFSVTIIDDDALEVTEDFFLNMLLAGNSSVPVFVDPPVSEVDIVDDDSKQFTNTVHPVIITIHSSDVTFGFKLTAIEVKETVDVVTLVVSVLDGRTMLPVTITFATTDNGTATSNYTQYYNNTPP